jgi:hypothetical protein
MKQVRKIIHIHTLTDEVTVPKRKQRHRLTPEDVDTALVQPDPQLVSECVPLSAGNLAVELPCVLNETPGLAILVSNCMMKIQFSKFLVMI